MGNLGTSQDVSFTLCHVSQFSFLAGQCNSFVRSLRKKTALLIRSYRVMPPKSRATQRLLAHNVSPARESRKRSRSERQEAEARCESSKGSRHNSPPRKEPRSRSKSSSRSKSKSSGRSNSPDNTPSWAKKLLEAHERSEERLQFLEKELKSRPSTERCRTNSPQPEFKYKRNKIQYELNEKVLDKLEVAASASDEKARNDALEEGKKILKERNKHIVSRKVRLGGWRLLCTGAFSLRLR